MPANIQGLNIVQPQQSSSDPQDLVSGQPFPNISAELDLWTNLHFDTEEGSLTRPDDDKHQLDEDESKSSTTTEKSIHDSFINVAATTGLDTNLSPSPSQLAALHHLSPHLSAFDINSLLSGFGIDPFASLSQQPNSGTITPSLAQLLALHSQTSTPQHPIPPQFSNYATPPAAVYPRVPHLTLTTQAPPSPSPSSPTASTTTTEEHQPKRSRPRKASISNTVSSESPSLDSGAVSVVAAEDKRRRNTAASARFRLKKKEREAALEGKAKELETRVNELERECEGLRRENGWLKGLVVGVTGAAQAPVVTAPPNLSASQLASLANATSGAKRSREEPNH